jgi:SAM-dependent methyltransferase
LRERLYLECSACGLIHLSREQRLDADDERAHYETHENDPTDPGYRAFLSRLVDPLVERLPPNCSGLDYGSGPGPTLSVMLEERGFRTAVYDPFFSPEREPLQRTYDFITCSETAEHFFDPSAEFDRLDKLLRPGGWLGVMTDILVDGGVFERWHYWREPVHVSFYRPRTMEWIARKYSWSLEKPHRNVAMFHKP